MNGWNLCLTMYRNKLSVSREVRKKNKKLYKIKMQGTVRMQTAENLYKE